jgi:hypothetical protein
MTTKRRRITGLIFVLLAAFGIAGWLAKRKRMHEMMAGDLEAPAPAV